MSKLITFFLISATALLLLVSCGQKQVKLDPVALEAQYVELTPYWQAIFTNKAAITDQNAAIGFSKYYQESRDLLAYYYDPSRDHLESNEVLWKLRQSLNSASARTNKIFAPK